MPSPLQGKPWHSKAGSVGYKPNQNTGAPAQTITRAQKQRSNHRQQTLTSILLYAKKIYILVYVHNLQEKKNTDCYTNIKCAL